MTKNSNQGGPALKELCHGNQWFLLWRKVMAAVCIFPNAARSTYTTSVLPVDCRCVHGRSTVKRIYITAPKRSWVLSGRQTKTTQEQSVDLCKPVLDSIKFSPLLMGKLVFHVPDHISKPNFVRERWMTLQGQLTDTPMSINREAPNRWKKDCGQGLWLVGRRCGLEPPRRHFDRKNRHKTLNSVTVHLWGGS